MVEDGNDSRPTDESGNIITPHHAVGDQKHGDFRHTDIALTGVFNALITTLNSERQAVWQRYNVLLLAHAAIISFASVSGASPDVKMTVAGFGILLCGVWYLITREGYVIYRQIVEMGLTFSWQKPNDESSSTSVENPLSIYDPHMIIATPIISKIPSIKSNDLIRDCAYFIIGLIAFHYFILLFSSMG